MSMFKLVPLAAWIALTASAALAQPASAPLPAPAASRPVPPSKDQGMVQVPPPVGDRALVERPPAKVDPGMIVKPPSARMPADRSVTPPVRPSRQDDCRGAAELCKQDSAR
jgi:hypothetical protein